MSLYIKIANNIPVGHPLVLDNLQALYGNEFSKNCINYGYYPCTTDVYPEINSPYFKCNQVYTVDGETVHISYDVSEMSDEEKQHKINEFIENTPKPYTSWVLDEEMLCYVPPIPMPEDGLLYTWDEEEIGWIEI